MNKAVVGCLSALDLAAIQRARSTHAEAVAVMFDIGQNVSLRELHDAALAAGAVRCHAVDVREEFARECVLPAVHADTLEDAVETAQSRGRAFVARKLREVARLEGNADVVYAGDPPPIQMRSIPHAIGHAASVTIAFGEDMPVAINHVTMSPAELVESLRTIAAAHRVEQDGALALLHAAGHARRMSGGSDSEVTLAIDDGAITFAEPEYTAA